MGASQHPREEQPTSLSELALLFLRLRATDTGWVEDVREQGRRPALNIQDASTTALRRAIAWFERCSASGFPCPQGSSEAEHLNFLGRKAVESA